MLLKFCLHDHFTAFVVSSIGGRGEGGLRGTVRTENTDVAIF